MLVGVLSAYTMQLAKKITSQCEPASSVVLIELRENDIYSIWQFLHPR